MINYIYEMHVTLLRINYLLGEKYYCNRIDVRLWNHAPHDMTNLDVQYACDIWEDTYNENENKIEHHCILCPVGGTLDELKENVMQWMIKESVKNVSKAVSKFNNSMTNQAAAEQ